MLTGFKTWLGALAVVGPELVEDIAKLITEGGGNAAFFVKFAGKILVVIGLLHKIQRGA